MLELVRTVKRYGIGGTTVPVHSVVVSSSVVKINTHGLQTKFLLTQQEEGQQTEIDAN